MSTNVQFEASASRHSTSRTSDGSILSAILRSASANGIDPVAELYNEALELAKEGHYGQARARLQVLLGLAPSDGDAHLLLAKVYVAGQQWRRAIATLDEASQCGASVPDALRDAVVRHLQSETDHAEEREVREVREQGELKKLRSEARRLRSENAHLASTNRTLEKESVRWMWIATATSVIAILFILGRMVVGGGQDAALVASEAASDEAATEAVAAAEVDDLQVRDPDLQTTVLEALQAAGLPPSVTVAVRGSRAVLGGTVPDHVALKRAGDTVQALDGIDDVSIESIVNLAVRDGAVHEVAPGESLSVIAYRMYGDQGQNQRILDANPQLGGKTNLKVGQKLIIPPLK